MNAGEFWSKAPTIDTPCPPRPTVVW
jgi:hypothetical protein